jgi:hypothetical protein
MKYQIRCLLQYFMTVLTYIIFMQVMRIFFLESQYFTFIGSILSLIGVIILTILDLSKFLNDPEWILNYFSWDYKCEWLKKQYFYIVELLKFLMVIIFIIQYCFFLFKGAIKF